MEWGKLYANLPDDPRVQAAEADAPGAGWLLIESMCYCTRAERGGYIPRTQVDKFGSGALMKRRVAVLVREELWLPVDGGGYELNPDVWTEERNLNDSAEKKKAADRARIKASRAAKKAAESAEESGGSVGDMSRDSSATGSATGSGDSRTLDQSREDKTTTSDDLVGHPRVADARGPDDDDDQGISPVAAELSRRAGRPVTADEGRRVTEHFLGKAAKAGTPVRNRAAYVIASIGEEPDVHALLFNVAPMPAGRHARSAYALPEHCGSDECNKATRMREKPDGTPYRCPDCGPEAMTA